MNGLISIGPASFVIWRVSAALRAIKSLASGRKIALSIYGRRIYLGACRGSSMDYLESETQFEYLHCDRVVDCGQY